MDYDFYYTNGHMKTCSNCKVELTLENARLIKRGRLAGQFQGYCSECHRRYNAEQYRKNPERAKKNFLRRRYGISEEQAQKLVSGQAGICEICGIEKATSVDHCHKTGKVRGLLCSSCNWGLGNFKDSPERLEIAASYLRK